MGGSPSPNFGLSQIGQIAVPVRDVERAIAFYRDVLGMRFLFQAPPGRNVGGPWRCFRCEASPDREDAGPRTLDGLLARSR